MYSEGVIGLLSFLSFGFSVIAAVLAIDTYALLRTGQSGGTWRVLIIASVIFALMHALRLSEILNFAPLNTLHLSEIVELVFVISLTYAFYLQRRIFQSTTKRTTKTSREEAVETDALSDVPGDDPESEIDEDNDAQLEAPAHEWARLNGLPTMDFPYPDDDDDAVAVHDRRATDRRTAERRNAERRNL